MRQTKGPVLIDLEDTAAPSVADAPPVVDLTDTPQGEAMQAVARFASHKPSRLAKWFWGLLTALLGAVVSITAWDFTVSLTQ